MVELESIELSVPFSLFEWHCPQGPHTSTQPPHATTFHTAPRPARAACRVVAWGGVVTSYVVARGWVGGGWALVGARCGMGQTHPPLGATPGLSYVSCLPPLFAKTIKCSTKGNSTHGTRRRSHSLSGTHP